MASSDYKFGVLDEWTIKSSWIGLTSFARWSSSENDCHSPPNSDQACDPLSLQFNCNYTHNSQVCEASASTCANGAIITVCDCR